MKNFEYAAPRTEVEVVELLSEQPGRSEILAGGTDLVGLMKKTIVTPRRVVNVMEVPSLRQIEPEPDGGVRIGASVTLDVLMDHPLVEPYSAVRQAIAGISSMQLQCQGTIGGELCQRPQCWFFRSGHGLLADGGKLAQAGDNRFHAIVGNTGPAKFVSASRLAPALIALGAQVRIVGPNEDSEALLPLAQLYRTPRHEGQRETILGPRQFVSHVILPAATMTSGTYEVRHGEGPDYPLAAAASALVLDAGRIVREAHVVMGQVAPVPWVSAEAARYLVGKFVDHSVAEAAGKAAVAQATPLAHNGYKVQLAKVAVKRSILLAAGLETGGF